MPPKEESRNWNDLKGKGRKPSLPQFNSKDHWSAARRKLKLFVYWKDECMPRYTFVRSENTSYWRGHGVHFTSMGDCLSWVREQPRPA